MAESKELTVADLEKCTMRETIHLNGGKEFFGYVLVCVQFPRLQRVDKCWRKTKTTTIEYRVDGAPVTSLEEAAEKLNTPPVITEELQAALDHVTTDYVDFRRTIDYELLHALANRNLIEWDQGRCRKTTCAVSLVITRK